MEKISLDIKTFITILAFAAAMGGFYYSTQSKLDSLTLQINGYRVENIDIRKRISTLERKISRLRKNK